MRALWRTSIPFLMMVTSTCVTLACSSDDERVAQQQEPLYGLGSISASWPSGVVPVCWLNGTADLQERTRWILADTWAASVLSPPSRGPRT